MFSGYFIDQWRKNIICSSAHPEQIILMVSFLPYTYKGLMRLYPKVKVNGNFENKFYDDTI